MVIIVYRLKKDGEESNFLAVFFCYFQAVMLPRGNIGGGNKITNSKF